MTIEQHPARKTPYSEQNPYHRGLYLHSMIKAVAHILDNLQDVPELKDTGVRDLVSIIEERADALSLDLSPRVFCEGWEALSAAIIRDSSLGLDL